MVLDFSQVEICDSFFGRFIQMMADTVRLMGARVVVSGLQDAVVETLLDLDFDLEGIPVMLDVDDAVAFQRAEGGRSEPEGSEQGLKRGEGALLVLRAAGGTQDDNGPGASLRPDEKEVPWTGSMSKVRT